MYLQVRPWETSEVRSDQVLAILILQGAFLDWLLWHQLNAKFNISSSQRKSFKMSPILLFWSNFESESFCFLFFIFCCCCCCFDFKRRKIPLKTFSEFFLSSKKSFFSSFDLFTRKRKKEKVKLNFKRKRLGKYKNQQLPTSKFTF